MKQDSVAGLPGDTCTPRKFVGELELCITKSPVHEDAEAASEACSNKLDNQLAVQGHESFEMQHCANLANTLCDLAEITTRPLK